MKISTMSCSSLWISWILHGCHWKFWRWKKQGKRQRKISHSTISKLFPANPSLFLSSDFKNLFTGRYKDYSSCILIILVWNSAKNFKCSCNNRRSATRLDPRNVFLCSYLRQSAHCDWERTNNAMTLSVDPGNKNRLHHLRFWAG